MNDDDILLWNVGQNASAAGDERNIIIIKAAAAEKRKGRDVMLGSDETCCVAVNVD